MKKIVSFLVVVACATNLIAPAFALNVEEQAEDEVSVTAVSEEYPDAYITTEVSHPEDSSSDESVVEVTATAYVEEDYNVVDGKVMTTSRLLSENEVAAIGEENFLPFDEAVTTASSNNSKSSNKKGKLSISLKCTTDKLTSTKSQYSFVGKASWSGFDAYKPKYSPAAGEDYFGLCWGGGFAHKSTSASAKLVDGSNTTITLCDSESNKGLVWSFNEYVQKNGVANFFVKPATIKTTLYKNKRTGNGNTTSAVLKYIHTYTATTGSISISTSGIGFSLSGSDKQWSIVCTMSNLKY